MTIDQIIEIQTIIKTPADGEWGLKSSLACRSYLLALMPRPVPWPLTREDNLSAFYGKPGDESKHTRIDVAGLGIAYDGKPVSKITCHQKVAESLRCVLVEVNRIHPEVLAKYAGVYNNRLMRGGTKPSLHARAAAIDLDPDANGLHTNWPQSATMPFAVMIAFAREGWLSAGAFWGRDAMHFQATQ